MMKLMRLALCAAAFAMIGGIAMSEDMDIRALQAKLAAQEARINDLQAKMNQGKSDGGAAKGVTSIRKNAVVTLGGTMNARYLYRDGEVKSKLDSTLPGATAQRPGVRNERKIADYKGGDLRIHDAKLDIKVDVNENVDAFVKIDLHDGGRRSNVSGVAQHYWIRWKNICNTGFGILAGRDAIKFGDSQVVGQLDTWTKDGSGQMGEIFPASRFNSGNSAILTTAAGTAGTYGQGMFAYGSMQPAHTMTNWQRTTQITPYWESKDKKFKAEVSFIQAIDTLDGAGTSVNMTSYDGSGRDYAKYRTINYGLGSMTARITWTPIEGLKLVASGLNMYSRTSTGNYAPGYSGNRPSNSDNNSTLYNYGHETSSNYTAVNLAFRWRPCFLKQLQIFGQWNHGWNEAWVKDMDSDVFLLGAMYDFNKRWTVFAQGEYLRTKNDNADIWHKATGWNIYAGIIYKLPYGAQIEAGYRHENIKYKGQSGTAYSGTHTKLTADTIYANLGFNF